MTPSASGDGADVLVPAFERERRCPCDHLQLVHLRERVDDFFGETVGEVLVLRIRAEVGEGQDRDRWPDLGARDRRAFERQPDLAHRLKSALGHLLETTRDDLLQLRRRHERRRLIADDREQHASEGVARERADRRQASRRARRRS